MYKRDTNINLIVTAAKIIESKVDSLEFDQIIKAHDIVLKDEIGSALDLWVSPEMYNFEQVVRIVAEDNNLTELTDTILDKLEQ